MNNFEKIILILGALSFLLLVIQKVGFKNTLLAILIAIGINS